MPEPPAPAAAPPEEARVLVETGVEEGSGVVDEEVEEEDEEVDAESVVCDA